MPLPCDREGSFRANITEYGLKEMDSGAVSIGIKAQLLEWYDGEQWVGWADYDMEAEGDIWIVKKNQGGIAKPAVESLIRHAGWDGSIESIVNQTWQPTSCQVFVQREDYQGTVRFKIKFVNDHDRTPGSMNTVSPEKGRELANQYNAQLRAIAGNARRNGAPVAGKPPTPAPARPAPPPPPRHGVPAETSGEGQIPF